MYDASPRCYFSYGNARGPFVRGQKNGHFWGNPLSASEKFMNPCLSCIFGKATGEASIP